MNRRKQLASFAASLLGLLLVSCASQPPTVENPSAVARVWPPKPDEPRIAFVRYLRGPRDVGQKPSALHTVADWLTGDTGENLNLRKPFAVALDEHGGLCLADTDTRQVSFADFTAKKWRSYDGVGKTKFASPVAVARHAGVFYAADSELGKVFAFRDDGTAAFEISAPLQRPVGLAVANDLLFVVDSQAHTVFAFGLDGKLQFQFGRRGNGDGEFNFPTCIAADGQGRLLVTDTLNSRVQIFDRAGKYLAQFGSTGDTSGHFARPKGIAADSAGRIYVVDTLFDNFQVFSGDGKLLLNVGETGGGPGGFGLPSGIAIGGDDRIYVADAYNHRVQVFEYIGQP
jgi:NHL repeat